MRNIKKALKWVIVMICLMQNAEPLMAQTEDENLRKYWNYRDRFRKYFTWIGSGEGKSLTMANNDPDSTRQVIGESPRDVIPVG